MANRLAHESSPYLLQHAHNPVDWWAWCDEAINEARRRDVPILVSIGYSTCYWCHVMERESFENAQTARVMNERFVCIKVDREERPDLDDACMAAVQMLTGHGGWPLNVFLDPRSLAPFWGGTYFPPVPAHGRPSFTQVLERLSEAYQTRRDEITGQAAAVAKEVAASIAARREPVLVGQEQVIRALQTLLTIFDRTHGGFGGAPKFPQPVYARLLLDVRGFADSDDTRAAIDHALRFTLDRMALGGLFDQVGGGFHRYATDAIWLVPHFEKMLYDQAQLLEVYADAAAQLGDPFYAHIAKRTAAYLAREMTDASGAFFSAQDAEVDGREGLNYLWTPDEVRAALAAEDAEFALDVYGLAQGPNFRDPHHPGEPPRNVLHLAERPEEIARRKGVEPRDIIQRLERINAALLAVRDRRKQPRLDDKVITAWNGLMIAGLARAGMSLGDEEMVDMAARAARAVLAGARADLGLLRSTRDGQGAIPAVLDDYAALTAGLLALARARPREAEWLSDAERLTAEAGVLFGDRQTGGYGDVREHDPSRAATVFVRARSTYDGAMPSPAGIMLHNLVDLAEITRSDGYEDDARRLLLTLSAAIHDSPISTVNATRGLLRLLARDPASLHTAMLSSGAKRPAAKTDQDPVEVLVSDDEIPVGPEQPAEFFIRLNIARGFHINSAHAGEQSGGTLVPLALGITGGAGVKVYADYPEGMPLPGAAHTVHEGTIEFAVALEAVGEVTGEPRLTITYQPCDDTRCLRPVTSVLDVHIVKA